MTTQHTQGRLTTRGGYSIYADDGKTPVAVVDANDDGYWADILPDRGG